MANIIYNGKKYEIPEDSTPQDTLDSLAMAMPELASAKLTKSGEDYKAEVKMGTKG